VLGKLLASMLGVLVLLAASLPLFMLSALFGGVSFDQIGRVFAVTLATAVAAGSLGSILALWREKTFQTLALTVLSLVVWGAAGADEESHSSWGLTEEAATAARKSIARSAHAAPGKTRQVWDNPILWREMATWAYGRRVLVIHVAYLVLVAVAAAALGRLVYG